MVDNKCEFCDEQTGYPCPLCGTMVCYDCLKNNPHDSKSPICATCREREDRAEE